MGIDARPVEDAASRRGSMRMPSMGMSSMRMLSTIDDAKSAARRASIAKTTPIGTVLSEDVHDAPNPNSTTGGGVGVGVGEGEGGAHSPHAMSQGELDVLDALSKQPEQRNEADLHKVHAATANVKFFERLTPSEHLELCRVMSYEQTGEATTVFSQGDEGTTLYIILSGAVKVFVADSRALAAQSSSDDAKDDGMDDGMDDGEDAALGTQVCVLEDGDSFGELALMGSGTRQATVVTAAPTHFLKIDKDVYEVSLQKMHEAELSRRVDFLQSVFIFATWSEQDLRSVAGVMTQRRVEKGATVISEGDATDLVYFLKDGGCRVLKRLPLSGQQRAMLRCAGAGADTESGGAGGGDEGSSSGGSDKGSVEHREIAREVLLEIGRLQPRMYFGELAMLERGTAHSATIVASSTVELLVLSKRDFYHCLSLEPQIQTLMQAHAKKFYMDDAAIRSSIVEQHRWASYKRDLLSELLPKKAASRATTSTTPRPARSPRASAASSSRTAASSPRTGGPSASPRASKARAPAAPGTNASPRAPRPNRAAQ